MCSFTVLLPPYLIATRLSGLVSLCRASSLKVLSSYLGGEKVLNLCSKWRIVKLQRTF